MNQIIALLQNMAQTAYKTQENLKTAAQYGEASGIAYINRLILLLDEIKINCISSTYVITGGISKEELQESIHTIFECMETVEEIRIRLYGTLSSLLPPNLKNRLDKNMQSLEDILLQLIPNIVRVYGKGKSALILTPLYQGKYITSDIPP